MNSQFLLSSLKLPVLSRDYAFHLDGDGNVDNPAGPGHLRNDATRLGHAGHG